MNELAPYRPQLPVVIQRQLDQQTRYMNYITQLAITALGEQSDIYSFAVIKVIQTLTTLAALKQAYAESEMPPETEALLRNLSQNYLQAMERIPQQSCEMIHQVLERASTPPDDGGWLGAVIDAFISRENG